MGKVNPLIKTYLRDTLRILTQTTDPSMLYYVLKYLRPLCPLILPYTKLTRKILRATMNIFGSGCNRERLHAIILIREFALNSNEQMMVTCVKGTVRVYLNNTKFYNSNNLSQ